MVAVAGSPVRTCSLREEERGIAVGHGGEGDEVVVKYAGEVGEGGRE